VLIETELICSPGLAQKIHVTRLKFFDEVSVHLNALAGCDRR